MSDHFDRRTRRTGANVPTRPADGCGPAADEIDRLAAHCSRPPIREDGLAPELPPSFAVTAVPGISPSTASNTPPSRSRLLTGRSEGARSEPPAQGFAEPSRYDREGSDDGWRPQPNNELTDQKNEHQDPQQANHHSQGMAKRADTHESGFFRLGTGARHPPRRTILRIRQDEFRFETRRFAWRRRLLVHDRDPRSAPSACRTATRAKRPGELPEMTARSSRFRIRRLAPVANERRFADGRGHDQTCATR